MSHTVEELVSQAQSLPDEDRALLVDRLMLTLYDYQLEIEEAWRIEAERRNAAIESGEMKTIPWEEAKKRLGL